MPGPLADDEVDHDRGERATVRAAARHTFTATEGEVLRQAATLVVGTGAASIALLIRRLGLYEAEARSLLDALHAAGIVAADQGGRARLAIVDEDELEERLDAYLGLTT